MQNLHELFLTELRDIYNAENQLTKALPKMAEAASNPELKEGFKMHLKQTQQQIQRLEQIFEELGEDPEGEPCEAMEGLIAEGEEILEMQGETDPSVLDAGLIAAAQKVEHYEIASYGTLCTWAEMMGHQEAKELLGQTLQEEIATDQKLSDVAVQSVNPEAMQMGQTQSQGRQARSSMR